jgi:hypothetical protein
LLIIIKIKATHQQMMRLNAQFCYCITMTMCITDRRCLLLPAIKALFMGFCISIYD